MRWIRCLVCDHEANLHDLFCPPCRQELARLTHSRAEPIEWVGDLKLHAAANYETRWAQYIRLVKSQNGRQLNSIMLDHLSNLVRHWAVELRRQQFHAVVAVPSQPWREFAGFSLGRWLGSEMALALGIPVLAASLYKTGSWFEDGQKTRNLYSRFRAQEKFRLKLTEPLKSGTRVLLIDDVCTSGASLRACQRLLNQAGAVCERAWVLARTPLGHEPFGPATQAQNEFY